MSGIELQYGIDRSNPLYKTEKGLARLALKNRLYPNNKDDIIKEAVARFLRIYNRTKYPTTLSIVAREFLFVGRATIKVKDDDPILDFSDPNHKEGKPIPPLIGEPKVSFLVGDITKLSGVRAIQNAANGNFLTGGGIDWAINHEAGQMLLEERRLLIPSDVVGALHITTAHDLKCDAIIHVVGPKCGLESPETQYMTKDQEASLFNIHYETLERAIQIGARTVALAAVSAAIFGCGYKNTAKVQSKAIKQWLAFPGNRDKIDRIVIVVKGLDTEQLSDYKNAVERYLGTIPPDPPDPTKESADPFDIPFEALTTMIDQGRKTLEMPFEVPRSSEFLSFDQENMDERILKFFNENPAK